MTLLTACESRSVVHEGLEQDEESDVDDNGRLEEYEGYIYLSALA